MAKKCKSLDVLAVHFGETNYEENCIIAIEVSNFSLTYDPSDRTMALGSTQSLTEMSARSISWG